MAATLDASLRLDSSQFTAGLGNAMKSTNSAVSKMSASFAMLKNVAVGGAIGSTFMDVARSVGTAYLEAEKLQNALKATAGNDIVGIAQYEELRKLSAQIGVNMETAAKASLQLRAVGMSASQSLNTIKTFQNAIRGTGGGAEELSRLLYGLKQLYGSAKPLQEEINQINEAFALAPALFNKAFGTSRAEELQKLGLSGKQVAEALIKMAEALPQVERGMGGAIDTLNARFKNLLVTTGEATSSFAKPVIEGTNFVLASIQFLLNSKKILDDYQSKKKAGVDFGVEDEDQRKLLRALDRQQKAEKDRLQALADAKKLQDSLDKGNQENRDLDAIKWQNEERFNAEQAANRKQAQDDAKRAADQAKKDAEDLADKQEAAMRRLQSAQESIYANKQNNTEDDFQRLENAKDELRKFQGGELDGQTYGPGLISANKYADAFEKLAKSGAELTEEQIEKYNKIMALRQEMLGIEREISDEAKNQADKTKEQNKEAVQKSIDKAGRTPAQRRQQIRDENDMERQRRRAFNDDVRDEMTRLKKEAEEKNKGRNILDRERTDREAFREQARKNITPKWADALPKETTLVDIRDILKNLAAA